jgi:CrcB protein
MIALECFGLLLVGGVGAVARFRMDGLIATRAGGSFPAGTLAVNLSGALILGLIAGAALPPTVTLIAGTGLVGSYTTFSTWMLETSRLAEEHRGRLATVNVGAGIVLGVLAVGCGQLLGGHL